MKTPLRLYASSNMYAFPELASKATHRTHLSQHGGGLAIGGTATLTDTKVYANQARDRVCAPSAFSMFPHAPSTATGSYTLFLWQGGGVHVTGTLTMATSTLMANRAINKEGANLYLGAGSTTTYVLPAPPGYWVPATRCEVWREACDRGDSACQAAAASCKANSTDNVDNCSPSGSCAPTTFNQPCDWQNNPALLGKTVYVLPLGSHDLDYPFACAAGVLGGSGSLTSQQTSATCARFCPAGFTCSAEATVVPAACPKGNYCPEGTSVALPCLPGSYSISTNLTSADECTETDKGHFAPTGSTE
eukprot:scaffold5059_cov72-Phaeocystis_antarctica.AAC.4